MKDSEKISTLIDLLDEAGAIYNNSNALPRLSDELAPVLKKWRDLRPGFIDPVVNMDELRRLVCSVLGVQAKDFLSSQKRSAADARRIFIQIVQMNSSTNVVELAAYLDNRHHSTIIFARDSHADLMAEDLDYRSKYNAVLKAYQKTKEI